MRVIRSLVLLLACVWTAAGAPAQTAGSTTRWDALLVVFDQPSPHPGVRSTEVHRQADGTLPGTLASD